MPLKKTIQNLPDEILVKVFTYLNLEDIVLGVRHVNARWKNVADDTKIWSNLPYRPPLHTPEVDIINILKQAPKLQAFFPASYTTKNVLAVLITYCKDIRKLELYIDDLKYSLVQKFVKACVNIEFLSIVEIDFNGKKCLYLISKCSKLKSLRLSGNVPQNQQNIFKDLADGCPCLQQLDLRNLYDYRISDLEYLLCKKKDKLESLHVRWTSERGKCTLPVVEQCSNLTLLHVEEYTDVKSLEGFGTLKKLPNLKTLSLPYFRLCNVNYMIDFFKTGYVSNLVKLDLSVFDCFENSLAQVIFERCHKIRHLKMVYCPQLTDKGLENIYLLESLECLNVSGCNNLTDMGVKHIVKCRLLRHLNLNSCFNLTSHSLVLCCQNLKILHELHLNGCRLDAAAALSIPASLKYLQQLDINGDLDDNVIQVLRTEMTNVEILLLKNCCDDY